MTTVAAFLMGGAPLNITRVRAQDAVKVAKAEATPSTVDWTPPTEESPRPKPAEWANATPLALPRPHALCSAQTLREWVRISCKSPKDDVYFGVRVLGGPHDDVRIADRDLDAGLKVRPRKRGTAIIFPMRPDDRRMFEIGRLIPGSYRSFSVQETTEVVISALWLRGDPKPTIVAI